MTRGEVIAWARSRWTGVVWAEVVEDRHGHREYRVGVLQAGRGFRVRGRGASWAAAVAAAQRWTAPSQGQPPCTAQVHRAMRGKVRRAVLHAAAPRDPRSRAWLRSKRPFPGRGWIGECYCGSSFVVDDPRTDAPYAAGVLRRIAATHGVAAAEIVGASRRPRVIAARAEAALDLWALGWTLDRVGAVLGRHRSRIAALLRRVGAPRDAELAVPEAPNRGWPPGLIAPPEPTTPAPDRTPG